MNHFNVAFKGKAAFEEAVSKAEKGDVIVYHVGETCMKAGARKMALGAYQAGLVLLVKERLSEDGVFSHRAIRTKKEWRPYREARDDDD